MILLDTHVLLWLISGAVDLGEAAKSDIQHQWEAGTVTASVFTFWEIALLHSKRRLKLDLFPRALHRRVTNDGLWTVPVDEEIAFRAVELGFQGFHPDPADRIIAATAIVGGYTLATADN